MCDFSSFYFQKGKGEKLRLDSAVRLTLIADAYMQKVTKNVKSMFNPKNRPSQQGERESRILISFPSGCCVLRKWAWWEWKPAVREFTNVLSIGTWGGEEATKLSTNINWLTCRKFLTRFVVCLLVMVVGSSSDFSSWRPGETGERSGLFLGPSKPQCFLYMK